MQKVSAKASKVRQFKEELELFFFYRNHNGYFIVRILSTPQSHKIASSGVFQYSAPLLSFFLD